MSSDRGDRRDLDARVDEIFDRALDVPKGERAALLDEACRGDADLRARVERLLAFSDDPPSLLGDRPVAELWRPDVSEAAPVLPERVGPYRILEEIGRGGMGVVYLGERADGHFEQKVAVKVMRPGSETPEARRRFEQERQIIASLQHANIARLYDGGVTEDGRPYSAMELVEGKPITAYCDDHRLSIAERLRLAEVVAGAVHYAHQNLVVHCDLKPSNILVTEDGEIKLLDFGIAKLLSAVGADVRSRTPSGSRAITPLYASPEQLLGQPVTTASDVYQLGLLLFELLAGERARDALSGSGSSGEGERSGTAPRRTPSEAVRCAPGERMAAVSSARGTRPRDLGRLLKGDLDLVVRAAMGERPEDRYRSAAALVEDLKRYRRSEPLAVRPATFGYRASRFVRRNRLSVGIGALLVVLLIGYSITVTVQARKIARERDRAQRIQAFAVGTYGAGDPDRALGPELSAADLIAHGVRRAEVELTDEPDMQAEVKSYLGGVYMRLGYYDEAEKLYRDVLTLLQEDHGDAHPQIATAQSALGRLLLERDDPEALSLLESALELRRRYLGPDHLDTARTLTWLGFYLRSEGRYQEAEERFREALGILRQRDPESTEHASALLGLAWAVRLQGRPEEAEPLVREGLEIRRRLRGEVHPDVATAWNDLANVLWQLERWDEGDEAIRRSIETKKGLYGEAHPGLATSLGNLAGALRRRGEVEQAVVLYRQALEMRRETLGPSHPRVAQSAAQLAEVLHLADRYADAEPLFMESLAIFREHLAEDHPSFGRVWRGLGTLLLDAGRLDDARRALEASRAVYAGVEGSQWPWRLDVLLAGIDRRQARPAEAEARLEAAEGKFGDNEEWARRWREEKAKVARD